MTIEELQQKQAAHDAKYWQHNDSPDQKIRHITLHIGKLVGKCATYCEAMEHGAKPSTDTLRNEVVPDLLFYAFQLANLFEGKADEQYLERLHKIQAKQDGNGWPE